MKDFINKVINIKGADKILHLAGGFLIAAIVFAALNILSQLMIILLAVIVIGVLKELYDYFTDGLFSWFDLLATLAGGILFILIIIR